MLPLSYCQVSENNEYKKCLKSINRKNLVGVLLLNKFNIKKSEFVNQGTNRLLDKLMMWNKGNNNKVLSRKIGQRIRNDFIKGRTVIISDFLFSKTEFKLFMLFKKHGISI